MKVICPKHKTCESDEPCGHNFEHEESYGCTFALCAGSCPKCVPVEEEMGK